ncbi:MULTISPECIES: type II toxin-antitoxin system RelE/ParE family toxin [unclassified Bradyrhizobium]|uniref:type II toxin-antitoxin system RelE/ParE family toxin n=1 Tax=unclassified Bradyrhizobium TaxID=2631580 RepID=UPI002916A355|nr:MULTISPECIES: type II toxin-antitoxin system RelE/ParE family toxin [unclassified Bradyrhizobium]
MKVRFTLEALTHIDAIGFYLGHRSPAAAAHIVGRIFADCDRLAEFPHLGHVGSVRDTYEWTVAGLLYIVVHEINQDESELIIIGVFHGAQRH